MAENEIDWKGGVPWEDFFQRNGRPGGADLLCVGPHHFLDRLAELLFFVLAAIREKSGQLVYQEFLLLLPPGFQGEVPIAQLAEEGSARIRGRSLSEEELTFISRRARVERLASAEATAVLDLVRSASSDTFVLVGGGAAFRDPLLTPIIGPNPIEEDVWVPHLRRFVELCIEAAGSSGACVLVDAGQYMPTKEPNQELISSIPDCGIVGGRPASTIEDVLAERGDSWIAGIKYGQKAAVLSAIESLPSRFDNEKPVIKAQVLGLAGEMDEAAEIIRTLELSSLPPKMKIRLAGFSRRAGDAAMGRELVHGQIEGLDDQQWLEMALVESRLLGLESDLELAKEKLETFFPSSSALSDLRFVLLIKACRAAASAIADGRLPDMNDFYLWLPELLSGEAEPDYVSILQVVAERWPQKSIEANFCCAVNARERDSAETLVWLARPDELSGDFARSAAFMLLWAMEVLILDARRLASDELLADAIVRLLTHLALNPADARVRVRLAELMSTQVSASKGIALLAYATLRIQQSGLPLREPEVEVVDEISEADFTSLMTRGFEWLGSNGPFVLGSAYIPKSLLEGTSADAAFVWLEKIVDYLGEGGIDDGDIHLLQQLLALGFALAPHKSQKGDEFELLRHVATRFVLAGRVQNGRDLVEHGLAVAGHSALNSRLAWLAFSDVYQRGQNHVEALIGLGSALACSASVDPSQAFYEVFAAIRIFRDVGFVDFAEALIPMADELLSMLHDRKDFSHRLETIRLTLHLARLSQGTDQDTLTRFSSDLKRNISSVFDANDELLPVTVLAVQIQAKRSELGLGRDADLDHLIDRASAKLGPQARNFLLVAGGEDASAADLMQWASQLQGARYSGDVGFDLFPLVRAAHKLLSGEEAAGSPTVATFAIELTADHAVTLPQTDGSTPSWLPTSVEQPGQLAIEVSRKGCTVTFLAMDALGRLVHVSAREGLLGPVVYEPSERFSEAKLDSWSEEFPYAYGLTEDDNVFWTSMDGLEPNLDASAQIVLVADTQLQRIPFNLLLVRDREFLGKSSAVAVVPSISWLNASCKAGVVAGNSSHAWVPTETGEGSDGTLAMVADRIEETLDRHRISMSTGSSIPDQLKGADLAIVAAHGGVADEGRFFQTVSDESRMRLSSIDLSRALSNSRIVILFVCSGGRIDRHPVASTAIALPKELLDRGTSAVIASPWPLDARVPSHWLPAFLQAWDEGMQIIEANFIANKAVAKAMGESPRLCLAMSLYGNPFLAKNSVGDNGVLPNGIS